MRLTILLSGGIQSYYFSPFSEVNGEALDLQKGVKLTLSLASCGGALSVPPHVFAI